jgi:flagellar biosynthesis chaperone FliJ
MKPIDLARAIKAKTIELELAIEFKKSHEDILNIYKQLKELQYQKLHMEQNPSEKDLDLA